MFYLSGQKEIGGFSIFCGEDAVRFGDSMDVWGEDRGMKDNYNGLKPKCVLGMGSGLGGIVNSSEGRWRLPGC